MTSPTNFHPNSPIGLKVAPTSEVSTFAILEWLELRVQTVGTRGIFQSRQSQTKSNSNSPNS
jgi:hypothetical protein